MRLDSEKRNRKLGLRAEVTLEKETPEFRKVQVRVEVKFSNFVGDNFSGRTIPRRL